MRLTAHQSFRDLCNMKRSRSASAEAVLSAGWWTESQIFRESVLVDRIFATSSQLCFLAMAYKRIGSSGREGDRRQSLSVDMGPGMSYFSAA